MTKIIDPVQFRSEMKRTTEKIRANSANAQNYSKEASESAAATQVKLSDTYSYASKGRYQAAGKKKAGHLSPLVEAINFACSHIVDLNLNNLLEFLSITFDDNDIPSPNEPIIADEFHKLEKSKFNIQITQIDHERSRIAYQVKNHQEIHTASFKRLRNIISEYKRNNM